MKKHDNLTLDLFCIEATSVSISPEPAVEQEKTILDANVDLILSNLDRASKKQLRELLTKHSCSEFLLSWKHDDPTSEEEFFIFNEVEVEIGSIDVVLKLCTKFKQSLGDCIKSYIMERPIRRNWLNAVLVPAAHQLSL